MSSPDVIAHEAPDEVWDLVDAEGRPLGRTLRRGDPMPEGAFHIVSCIAATRGDGEVLLTRRSAGKDGWSLLWELPGGSALAGETSEQAARRELLEETGLTVPPDGLELIGRHTETSAHVDLYRAQVPSEIPVVIDPVEVAEHAWALPDQVEELLRHGRMAGPWTSRLAHLGPGLRRALSPRRAGPASSA